MFCRNCGKQNPDGAKFCSDCGRNLSIEPVHQVPPVQKAPKKGNLLQRILAGVVSFVVASLVGTMIAGSFTSAPDVEPSSGAPSQAYSNLFWNNGANVPESDFAGQGLKTVSYAIHHGEGLMENMEYVYEDGYVLAFIDSIYVPIYHLDDASRAELNTVMQSNLSTYTSLSFCQLSSYEDNGFYVYKLIFTDLDEKENVRQLSHTDIISVPEGKSEVSRIGIKQTEDSLLASGYAKR